MLQRRRDGLSRFRVPDPRRLVVTGRDDAAAVRAERRASIHCRFMEEDLREPGAEPQSSRPAGCGGSPRAFGHPCSSRRASANQASDSERVAVLNPAETIGDIDVLDQPEAQLLLQPSASPSARSRPRPSPCPRSRSASALLGLASRRSLGLAFDVLRHLAGTVDPEHHRASSRSRRSPAVRPAPARRPGPRATRWRRIDFRNKYPSVGGCAWTGSPRSQRARSAASSAAVA